MPANLTPQYQKAEREYRHAQSAEERVALLEEMLKLIPKHKGTEKLQADLKHRLKETRAERQQEQSAPKTGKSYRFPRQGAGQALIIGGPNSGKSRLLAELTKAEPDVADYPFTTREPMPGMMDFEDVTVQLIDTPPVTDTHIEPYLINLLRSTDLCLLCFNGASDDAPEETAMVIEQFESRHARLSAHTGFDDDDFSIVHVHTLLVVTRGDADDVDERLGFFAEMRPHQLETVRVEFDRSEPTEALRETIYRSLGVKRIYTKRPGKPAEYDSPFTIPAEGTVEDLACQVHRDLAETLKFAKVWGESARDGQSVGREHLLADKDLVELH